MLLRSRDTYLLLEVVLLTAARGATLESPAERKPSLPVLRSGRDMWSFLPLLLWVFVSPAAFVQTAWASTANQRFSVPNPTDMGSLPSQTLFLSGLILSGHRRVTTILIFPRPGSTEEARREKQ
jgi:hypothetical protein